MALQALSTSSSKLGRPPVGRAINAAERVGVREGSRRVICQRIAWTIRSSGDKVLGTLAGSVVAYI